MKKMFKFVIPLMLIGAALGFTLMKPLHGNGQAAYQFKEITKGDVVNTVSSTGTLEAVSTVEVGTQVSGIIDKLYVDFNDIVKKGQLLAVLDTVLLNASLKDAQANMEKAEAQYELAQADLDRYKPMFEKGLISESEFLTTQVSVKTERANLKSAEVALQRATQNLNYAFIKSPINGTIIQRSVEEGQTVAASMSTPTLFIIAEDLSKMEIHAQVDESDIGMIKDGQSVEFDVQSYPDLKFTGQVRQIRLQPTTESNVVTYTVVVDTENKDNILLPGMTATIDFIIEESRDVLLVPNIALRYQPSEDELNAVMESMPKPGEGGPGGPAPEGMENKPPQGEGAPPMGAEPPADMGHVWYLKDGKLAMAMFKAGATDGKFTEIVASRELKKGVQVISGRSNFDEQALKEAAQQRQGGGPPRPF